MMPGGREVLKTRKLVRASICSQLSLGDTFFHWGTKCLLYFLFRRILQRPLFASVDKDSWVIFKLFPPKFASNNLIQIKPLLNLHHGQGKPTCPTETKTCEEALIVFHFVQMAIMMPENAVRYIKTSPQAKRHKSSLHVTSLHFFSVLCLF